MPIQARQPHASVTEQFEFAAFTSLSCGCVAVVHRTLDPGLSVVSLEAKGTYCALIEHVMGRAAAVPSSVTSEIAWAALEED